MLALILSSYLDMRQGCCEAKFIIILLFLAQKINWKLHPDALIHVKILGFSALSLQNIHCQIWNSRFLRYKNQYGCKDITVLIKRTSQPALLFFHANDSGYC
jgi:hypothetical protein